MSSTVKQHALSARCRAVVMLNGGLTQVQVRQAAEDWAENPQTLDRFGEMLENRKGRRERKTALSRVANIVVAMCAPRRYYSTRMQAPKRMRSCIWSPSRRAPLFAALPATETAQTAQTGSSTTTETARFRASSPQLAQQGVETGALLR